MSNKEVALVVDGSNFLWRAYSAPFEFRSDGGVRLDVVTVFMSLLRACVETSSASHVVVVFDHPNATNYRLEDKDYKSNRVQDFSKELDSPFHHLDNLKKVLDYLQITWLESALAEADDIIFTLAKSFNGRVLIASSDTDFYQCVSDDIGILKVRGSKNIEILDKQWIHDRLGVYPKEYVRFKAFTGDKADNIAGVRGVGPKTAAKIVNDGSFASNYEVHKDLVAKNVGLIELAEINELEIIWGEWFVNKNLLVLKNRDVFNELGF